MLFWKKKTPPLVQSSASAWREQWRAIVPPECRNVPVTVGDKTVTAYMQINHFVMMLQDGLLMEEHFFDVCSHFQRAGYHVIWLMRCTQDIENSKSSAATNASGSGASPRRTSAAGRPTTAT